jgi:hypothetical protein
VAGVDGEAVLGAVSDPVEDAVGVQAGEPEAGAAPERERAAVRVTAAHLLASVFVLSAERPFLIQWGCPAPRKGAPSVVNLW